MVDGTHRLHRRPSGSDTLFRAIDLTAVPWAADRTLWTHPTDYSACQDLTDAAREAGAALIRYPSVRDPEACANPAVLTCNAFADSEPVERHTWRIRLGANGAQAICEHPALGLEFPLAAFAGDPRLARFAA